MHPRFFSSALVLLAGSATGGLGCGSDKKVQPPEYTVLVNGHFASTDASANQAAHDQVASAAQDDAQSMGDQRHHVFLGQADAQMFLAVDVWNSRSGIDEFYSNPDVQQSFGQLFDAPPDIGIYQRPAGYSSWGVLEPQPGTWIVTVTGTLRDGTDEERRDAHNQVADGGKDAAMSLGDYAHLGYLAENDSRAFLAIDLWNDANGMNAFFADPNVQAAFATLFASPPTLAVYTTSNYHQW